MGGARAFEEGAGATGGLVGVSVSFERPEQDPSPAAG